jgi:hypothetical protein
MNAVLILLTSAVAITAVPPTSLGKAKGRLKKLMSDVKTKLHNRQRLRLSIYVKQLLVNLNGTILMLHS